jgi:hypothetical protein
MIKKTVFWTRPNASVTWPWLGLAENDAHENWLTTGYTGTIDRDATETDTTYVLTIYFQTQEECDINANSAELLALLNKMQPDMDELGITRTVTIETV